MGAKTESANLLPDDRWFKNLRPKLKRWYTAHGRDLPWRRTRDAYAIWISEIMLQQTTVVAVIPYFERFLERFPDVRTLAETPQEEVLRLWEGLGYYSRARNLHRTAQQICAEHAGEFPRDLALLQALPGVGRYTAGAIASFAYDLPAPILEANTLRLYCRLLGYEGDPRSKAGQNLLWNFAEQIVPKLDAGAMNQALMELGGTLCSVSEPDCDACPIQQFCAARAQGTVNDIPQPKARPVITPVQEATVALHHNGRYLLYRRSEPERWAGLWDFPRYPLPDEVTTAHVPVWLSMRLLEDYGLQGRVTESPSTIRHSVTRYRITLYCYTAEYSQGELTASSKERRWFTPAEFGEIPLSVTGRKFARMLQ